MITDRIQRPNHQPIRQESRAKLAKQAANEPLSDEENARSWAEWREARNARRGPLIGVLLYLLGWPGVVVVVGGAAALWRWLP